MIFAVLNLFVITSFASGPFRRIQFIEKWKISDRKGQLYLLNKYQDRLKRDSIKFSDEKDTFSFDDHTYAEIMLFLSKEYIYNSSKVDDSCILNFLYNSHPTADYGMMHQGMLEQHFFIHMDTGVITNLQVGRMEDVFMSISYNSLAFRKILKDFFKNKYQYNYGQFFDINTGTFKGLKLFETKLKLSLYHQRYCN